MTERPILFSGPMVRAILAGKKTQTRRPLKPQPPSVDAVQRLAGDGYHLFQPVREDLAYWGVAGPVWAVREEAGVASWRCPYGAPGDRLWVRETWQQMPTGPCRAGEATGRPNWPGVGERPHVPSRWNPECSIVYRADGEIPDRWRPGIHMPRWASRLSLEVTGVRVERLDAITEEDARAEGMAFDGRWWLGGTHHIKGTPRCLATAREALLDRWDGMYGGGDYERDANPWVWVVEFRRLP